MLEFAVAMITSQQPSRTALPAKQKPALTPTTGTRPESLLSSIQEGVLSPPPPEIWGEPPRPGRAFRLPPPARPPPPSVNSTSGDDSLAAVWNMRSIILWFMPPWEPASTE